MTITSDEVQANWDLIENYVNHDPSWNQASSAACVVGMLYHDARGATISQVFYSSEGKPGETGAVNQSYALAAHLLDITEQQAKWIFTTAGSATNPEHGQGYFWQRLAEMGVKRPEVIDVVERADLAILEDIRKLVAA